MVQVFLETGHAILSSHGLGLKSLLCLNHFPVSRTLGGFITRISTGGSGSVGDTLGGTQQASGTAGTAPDRGTSPLLVHGCLRVMMKLSHAPPLPLLLWGGGGGPQRLGVCSSEGRGGALPASSGRGVRAERGRGGGWDDTPRWQASSQGPGPVEWLMSLCSGD